jgi:hypothetical protein
MHKRRILEFLYVFIEAFIANFIAIILFKVCENNHNNNTGDLATVGIILIYVLLGGLIAFQITYWTTKEN